MRFITALTLSAALLFTSTAFACGGHDAPKTAEESDDSATVATSPTPDQAPQADDAAKAAQPTPTPAPQADNAPLTN